MHSIDAHRARAFLSSTDAGCIGMGSASGAERRQLELLLGPDSLGPAPAQRTPTFRECFACFSQVFGQLASATPHAGVYAAFKGLAAAIAHRRGGVAA